MSAPTRRLPSVAPAGRAARAARTVATVALLQGSLPLNLVLVAAARTRPRPAPAPRAARRRTVLISGAKMTKALVLARAFHAAGHRVVMVETARYRWTAHRFSRAVDAFHVVPATSSPDYADALLRVVKEEAVDVYVPVCSPAASLPDAEAAALLEGHCEVVHLDAATLSRVDDKYEFSVMAGELGLPVAETHRVTDPQQVLDFDFSAPGREGRRYVLKSIAYDPVRRLDLTPLPRPTAAETEAFVRSLPISSDQPWILQELLEGTEYCTHGTVRDGRLQVYVCCLSSPWQLTYEMVDKPDIRAWVEAFVTADGWTGQLSFDFIEGVDGVPRAIECNPRTHSAITLLHGHPGLAAAYLDDEAAPVEPPSRRAADVLAPPRALAVATTPPRGAGSAAHPAPRDRCRPRPRRPAAVPRAAPPAPAVAAAGQPAPGTPLAQGGPQHRQARRAGG